LKGKERGLGSRDGEVNDVRRWLQLRFDFDSTAFDFRSTRLHCDSTVVRRFVTVERPSNGCRMVVERESNRSRIVAVLEVIYCELLKIIIHYVEVAGYKTWNFGRSLRLPESFLAF